MADRLCLMGCFAHPDDESYGAGGTTARYSAEGIRCISVTATAGEVGQILAGDVERDELGEHRSNELEEACKILGAEPILLDFPDGGLADLPEGELAARILELLVKYEPGAVVTFDKTGVTGHTDHIAMHLATTKAFEEWANPESRLFYVTAAREGFDKIAQNLEELGIEIDLPEISDWDGSPMAPDGADGMRVVPDEWVTTRVDTAEYAIQKKRAINCHVSQVGEEGFTTMMPDEMAPVAFPNELFALASGPRDGTADDLFGRGSDPE